MNKGKKLLLVTGFTLLSAGIFHVNAQTKPTVKWHPGHYILVKGDGDKKDYLQDHFLGIQRKYDWVKMETEKGKYDFSEIRDDLAFLQKHGKRLVIQIQTKGFGKGVSNTPKYLSDPEYGGSHYRTATGSLSPVYWNPKVSERIAALYAALGKAFDKEPYVEAVVIPETAVSSDIKNKDQEGVEHYTADKYADALDRQMKALRDAFPHTVVIQYTNFPVEALEKIINYQRQIGVGLGGPDVNLYSNLNDPKKGVYRFYDQVQGFIPLGTAVQSADYSYDNPNHPVKIPALPTMQQIYKFGRDRLHLNYMFWLNRPKYFEQVMVYMNSADFPKDAAGGLNTQLPSCYK